MTLSDINTFYLLKNACTAQIKMFLKVMSEMGDLPSLEEGEKNDIFHTIEIFLLIPLVNALSF